MFLHYAKLRCEISRFSNSTILSNKLFKNMFVFAEKKFKIKLLANTKVTQALLCIAIYVIALDFCTFAVLYITEKFLRVI